MLVFLSIIAIAILISTNKRIRDSKTSMDRPDYRKMIIERLAQIYVTDSDVVGNKIFQVEQAVPQGGFNQIVIELHRQKLSVQQTVHELSSGAWVLGPISFDELGEYRLTWDAVRNLPS
jgi:hypothetical protein